jgi:hypothetical protein
MLGNLGHRLLRTEQVYLEDESAPEEAPWRAFNWATSKGAAVGDSEIMTRAVRCPIRDGIEFSLLHYFMRSLIFHLLIELAITLSQFHRRFILITSISTVDNNHSPLRQQHLHE